jgi:pre-mRNA-splicing factor ATP-dependent RNA helicase DHX38/PRP16
MINVVVQGGEGGAEMSRADYEAAARKLQGGSAAKPDAAAERQRIAKEASYDMDTDAPSPERFAEIQAQRRTLPVYACRKELLGYVRENSVVVIAGETGSGKTTQIVQYLLEEGFAANGLIGCTQPRRMAAVGVSHRVAQEVGCKLGDTVGYAIRLEDVTSKNTRLKFMTDGVLMRELINDRMLRKYSVVVMDEAHERSVNTDVLLGAMKDVLRERLDFKLLVTSATMELDKFARFFTAPIYNIPGRTFPVDMHFERGPAMDYVESAVLKVLEIHAQEPAGDVLVFMTGEDDVEGTCELLRERAEALGPEAAAALIVLPCYSMLPSTQQRAILDRAPEGKRKVIVATNIAETSLTIDGIRYVVDAGYMKCKVFKPSVGMNALTLYPVSRAQANQRAGRAGRTAEGVCYRLYTEHQFMSEIIEAPVPEIQRSSVDSVVLLLKSIGIIDLAQFDFLDAPPQPNLEASLCRLWLIRALDDAGRITEDGRRIADFPADPPMARTMLEACKIGCGDEAVSVAAVLCSDSRSVFTMPKGREESAKAAREKFYAPDSDHVTLLNVFEQYVGNGMSRAWCDEHMLNHLALKRAADIRSQFADRLTRDFKLTLSSCDGNKDMVREAFAAGYFANSARRSSMTEYTTLLTGVPCELHPMSAVLNAGVPPDYIIFNELMMTNREYVSVVSAADPQWLISVSRGLFSTRDDQMMKHHVNLVREQRKAILAAAKEQSRAPQPAAEDGALLRNQVTNANDLSTAATAKPRFQPRRKK